MTTKQIRLAQSIAEGISRGQVLDYIQEQESLLNKNEPGSVIKRIDKAGRIVSRSITFGGVAQDSFQIDYSQVGNIIGFKGETLRSTELECRVRIQIERETVGTLRTVLITGRPQDVDHAKEVVDRQIDQVQHQLPKDNENTLQIPSNRIGLIIGKQGSMLRELQQRSQARIIIPRDQDGPERTVILEGDYKNCQRARQMIIDLISAQQDQIQQQYSLTIQVPATKIGLIIGRGGETIKQLNQETGTLIRIDQSTSVDRDILIQGPPDACEEAKRRIEVIIS